MDDAGIRKLIKADIKKLGSQNKLAQDIGVEGSFLSEIVREIKKPSEKIYNYFGYTRVCKLEKMKK